MTTTDTAVAENNRKTGADAERAAALGPGLLRFSGGTYHRPSATDASARCLGPLAYWKISNSYFLPPSWEGDEPPLFLFPLPAEASLLSLSIGGERIFPGRLAVSSTEALPEDAEVPAPFSSFVSEFGSDGQPVLSINLSSWSGALSGQPTVKVEIEYACGLPTVDGRICLRCPALVGPEWAGGQKFVYNLHVTIEDGNELVDEPVSQLGLQQSMEGDSLVLRGSFSEQPQDSTVTFRPGRTQMPVTRLRRSEQHFIFSIFPPTSIPASPQRRDIVFALDASENLDPEVYERVKLELSEVLRSLDENDRFALVTFGRHIDGYDGGEFCEVDKVEEACEWLADTKPQGRADVQPLLQRIQSLPSQEDRQLCIFLLAGGHVGNEPSILRSLDFDQSDRRYYTVGLGSSAKQSFLRRLALLTRGRCEVADHGYCREPVERLLGQTRALLAEVTFEELDGKTGVDANNLVPSKMTSLTPQGPVHCLGLGAPAALRFRSKDETGVFFAGTVNAQPTDNPALSGVWAGLRVRELLDSVHLTTGAKRKSLKAEATELASQSGILTEDTVLVLKTADGTEVQFSALPSCWVGAEPKEKKSNVSNKESAAPFDWRKGLVAREGLFKGSKVAPGGDSGESAGRFGLRSKTGQSSESPGKPRLDRSVMSGMHDDVDDIEGEEAVVDEAVAKESAAASTNGVSESQEAQKQAPAPSQEESSEDSSENVPAATPRGGRPVEITTANPSFVALSADSFSDAGVRFAAYNQQLQNYEAQLALSGLQGLPSHLSPVGGELPRILAQTVAHLEKRGYFSQAVSVLGLLLQDHASPEIEKKMESLLVGWVQSLNEEQLPEAIQILQLGQRICRGSEVLESQRQQKWDEWKSFSGEQGDLSEYLVAPTADSPADAGTIYSESQRQIAGLRSNQERLESKLEALQSTVAEQLESLPGVLEQLMSKTLEKAAQVTAEAVAAQLPAAVASQQPAVSSPSQAPQEQPAPVPQSPEPVAEVVAVPETAEIEIPTPTPEPLPTALQPDSDPDSLETDASLSLDIPLPTEATPEPTPEAEPATVVNEQPVAEPEPVAVAEPTYEPAPEPQEEAAPVAPAPPPRAPEPLIEAVFEEPAAESVPMNLSLDELTQLVTSDPRSEATQRAVEANLTEAKERINFFRELVKVEKDEPHHSLSLARAYRAADQTKVAVVHYQKYLRTEKDAQAYLELADAYDELGKSNLSASARKAAEACSG